MPQTLKLANFQSNNILSQTELTADEATGVSALPAVNSVNFVQNNLVLIGPRGGQSSEILTTAAPADGNTVSLAAPTTLPHNSGEPLTLLFGDRIKVWRAPDLYNTGQQPPDDTFELITDETGIAIDPSQTLTSYTDPTGNTTYWYKYTYYNTISSNETDLPSSIAVWAAQRHYVSIDEVRRAAGLQDSSKVTNDIIAGFRDAAEKEINGALLPVYQFPLPQPTNPIILEIAKNIAAGELKREMYQNVSTSMADDGKKLASSARNGGGAHTSLSELVKREVTLQDANFNEQTIEEGHGFGGWPDETTAHAPGSQGGDGGPQFRVDQEY